LSAVTFVSASFKTTELPISARAFDNNSVQVFERLDELSPVLAFYTYEGGQYQFCVENLNPSPVDVDVDFKVGVEAKDYSGLADTKYLTPTETQVMKVSEVTKQIKKELSYIREREEQMRHTNQSIGERVVGYSVLTIVLLVTLSVLQIVYLRSFFRTKKLN
jgi:hypothetical protein